MRNGRVLAIQPSSVMALKARVGCMCFMGDGWGSGMGVGG